MLPAADTEFDGQLEQLPGPKPSLYWLMMHCEHAPPFAPVYPALHLHEVSVVLPAGDTEFDGQFEQLTGPKPSLYWLLMHRVHESPLFPVYPALH